MQLGDWSLLLLLSVMWGGSFLFMRVAAPVLGAVPLIALRVSVAAGCYGFAAVYARRHLSGVPTFDTAAYSQLAAAAALLPLVPGTWPRAVLTPQVLGAVLALGVVCTALVNRSAPARAVGPRSGVPGRGPSWLSRLLLRRRSRNTWRLSRRI